MKLFFLRHGIAEDAHGGMRDADRALTEEGRRQLAQIAEALLRLDVRPGVIVTSPLVRARETAEIVAPALGAPVEIADELQPGCILDDLQRVVSRFDADRIMVVGHEPDFSSMAARLINADERGLELKKAGLIRVDVDGSPRPGRGRLTALLTPKMLRLMAHGTGHDEPEQA
jgi:phosphohistidine phosphatase